MPMLLDTKELFPIEKLLGALLPYMRLPHLRFPTSNSPNRWAPQLRLQQPSPPPHVVWTPSSECSWFPPPARTRRGKSIRVDSSKDCKCYGFAQKGASIVQVFMQFRCEFPSLLFDNPWRPPTVFSTLCRFVRDNRFSILGTLVQRIASQAVNFQVYQYRSYSKYL